MPRSLFHFLFFSSLSTCLLLLENINWAEYPTASVACRQPNLHAGATFFKFNRGTFLGTVPRERSSRPLPDGRWEADVCCCADSCGWCTYFGERPFLLFGVSEGIGLAAFLSDIAGEERCRTRAGELFLSRSGLMSQHFVKMIRKVGLGPKRYNNKST